MPRGYQGTSPYPNRLRSSRGEQSQAAVAERAGILRPTLSEIENGERLATPDQLDALTAALAVPASDIYDADLLDVIEKARQRSAGEEVA